MEPPPIVHRGNVTGVKVVRRTAAIIVNSPTVALVGDLPPVSCLFLLFGCTITNGDRPTIPCFPPSFLPSRSVALSPATHLLSEVETSIDDAAASVAAAVEEDRGGFPARAAHDFNM